MTPKQYIGTRGPTGCCVTVDGRPLRLRKDLMNHSPTGFEWGYAGSGPAQLALALLAEQTRDDDLAVQLHQRFKRAFVSRWRDAWRMTGDVIDKWVKEQPREQV